MIKNPAVKLSLILPCYNEAEHFSDSIKCIWKVLDKLPQDFEIIFVEDKSTDNTAFLINQFVKIHPQKTKAIYHNENQGRGRAVVDGILAARGEFVGFIDIDCEVSPEYIPNCLDKLKEDYDIVCGERKYKTNMSGIVRALTSQIYSCLVKFLFRTNLTDTEAGYKFFRRLRVMSLLDTVRDKGWFWDTEVMLRAEKAGLRIIFLPVIFKRRSDKSSTVHLFTDSLIYLYRLLRLRFGFNQ